MVAPCHERICEPPGLGLATSRGGPEAPGFGEHLHSRRPPRVHPLTPARTFASLPLADTPERAYLPGTRASSPPKPPPRRPMHLASPTLGGPLWARARTAFRRPTLGEQLVVLLGAFALVPLLLSNLWGYETSREYRTQAAARDVGHLASFDAFQVFASLQEDRRFLPSLIAGNRHLFALMRTVGACEPPEDCGAVTTALVAQLRAKQSENSTIVGLVALAPDGKPMAQVGDMDGVATTQRCFAQAHQKPRAPELEAASQGNPVVLLHAPVRGTTGEDLGVLCARLRLGVEAPIAGDRSRDGARSFLLDHRARIVWSSDGDSVGRQDRRRRSGAGAMGWTLRAARLRRAGPRGVCSRRGDAVAHGGRRPNQPCPRRARASQVGSVDLRAHPLGPPHRRCSLHRPWHEPPTAPPVARRRARPRGLPRRESSSRAGRARIVGLARTFNAMSLALEESHSLLERRIAERTEELARSRAFADRLLDAIDQRVVVIDREGTVLRTNDAARKMYGEGARRTELPSRLREARGPLRSLREHALLRDSPDELHRVDPVGRPPPRDPAPRELPRPVGDRRGGGGRRDRPRHHPGAGARGADDAPGEDGRLRPARGGHRPRHRQPPRLDPVAAQHGAHRTRVGRGEGDPRHRRP